MLKKAEQGSSGEEPARVPLGLGAWPSCHFFSAVLHIPRKDFARSGLSGLFTSPVRQLFFTPGCKSGNPASQGR